MAGGVQRSPRQQRLAAALKKMRGDAGVSAEALGKRLGWSQSKVSKIENARTRPTPDDVHAWATALQAPLERKAELVEVANDLQTESRAWRELFRTSGGVDRRQEHYAELDKQTIRQEIFEPALVPGLLQTAEYARQVFTVMRTDDDPAAIARAAALRVDRQAVLYEGTMTLEAIVTEAALRWLPGSPAILAGQLDRILSMMTLESVRVGVLPLGAGGPVHLTSFTLRHLADEPPIVTVELLTEELTYAAAEHLDVYRAMFAEYRKVAVFGEDARRAIERIGADYRGQP